MVVGGGGGGSKPDVVLTSVADRAVASVGETIVFRYEARLGSSAPATKVVLTVELPANTELISTKVNRGAGCTGTRTITCDLDFLSEGLVAMVEVRRQGDEPRRDRRRRVGPGDAG